MPMAANGLRRMSGRAQEDWAAARTARAHPLRVCALWTSQIWKRGECLIWTDCGKKGWLCLCD